MKSDKRERQDNEIVGYVLGKKTRSYHKRMTSAPWDSVANNWPDEYNRLRRKIYTSEKSAQKGARKATMFNPVGFDVYPIYNPIRIID